MVSLVGYRLTVTVTAWVWKPLGYRAMGSDLPWFQVVFTASGYSLSPIGWKEIARETGSAVLLTLPRGEWSAASFGRSVWGEKEGGRLKTPAYIEHLLSLALYRRITISG